MTSYEPVIGLEVHAQLKTRTKIFCGCPNQFGEPPNTLVCPVCLGMPGVLPVMNEVAAELAVRAGLVLGCSIRRHSVFARKNYFYPDLPKGYQISQFDLPICEGGSVPLEEDRSIELTRIHLEEDAGKSFHSEGSGDESFIDLNRCGVPLVEIVTTPTIASADAAYLYLSNLKKILEFAEISDCNMEEGSLRVDANVSIRPAGSEKLGTKTEVKNLNSFRGARDAINAEIERQEAVVRGGGAVEQVTLLWDAERSRVEVMRSKEEAHDYRYFPEPDLGPLVISEATIEKVRSGLPELPAARRGRFVKEFGLREDDAITLTDTRAMADRFEETVDLVGDSALVSNFFLGPFLRAVNERSGGDVTSFPIVARQIAALLSLQRSGEVNPAGLRRVFEAMIEDDSRTPEEWVDELGLRQLSDGDEIRRIIEEVLDGNPSQTADYLAGKEKLFGYLMGQVMKATGGKANPGVVTPMMRDALESRRG